MSHHEKIQIIWNRLQKGFNPVVESRSDLNLVRMVDIQGQQTPSEKIAFIARPKIKSQSQIFRYGRSIFCLPLSAQNFGFLWFMPSLSVRSLWMKPTWKNLWDNLGITWFFSGLAWKPKIEACNHTVQNRSLTLHLLVNEKCRNCLRSFWLLYF